MPKRITKEQFIERSNKIHNNKFDYSKIEYIDTRHKIKIICPIHGYFYQLPSDHMRGIGCSKCSGKYQYTTDEWIVEAKKVHGDRYDYSLVYYKGNNKIVIIICPEHGEFKQKPNAHLMGHGCSLCANMKRNKNNTKTLDQFIKESNKIHNNFYDYSLVIYKNNQTKVKIICPIHGMFEQITKDHLYGHGCPKCYYIKHSLMSKKTTDCFIEEAIAVHGYTYDYSLVEYTGTSKKVKIICPIHGIFKQTPNCHLRGGGCRQCFDARNSKNKTLTTEQFIKKAIEVHGDRYDYSLVEYVGAHDKVKIICSVHGVFNQRPNNHLNGAGCSECSGSISNQEIELLSFIKENYTKEIISNTRTIISPLELDIYLPDLKLAFEYNGLYWHGEQNKDKDYHYNKTKLCLDKGIHLIHIYEDDWIHKNLITKSRILNLLGKSEVIYARKCKIKEVDITREFLVDNHIQGYCNSKNNYGLFYNDELVSLMTLGHSRFESGKTELLRFCNKLNTSVVGGASRLFKHAIKQNDWNSIISYADRSWSNGALYNNLGFTFIDITKPNYKYIIEGKRENRFKYRKSVLVAHGYSEDKTEHQIMLELEIYRIYDSGSLKFEFYPQ